MIFVLRLLILTKCQWYVVTLVEYTSNFSSPHEPRNRRPDISLEIQEGYLKTWCVALASGKYL